jgi:hypothetical protein
VLHDEIAGANGELGPRHRRPHPVGPVFIVTGLSFFADCAAKEWPFAQTGFFCSRRKARSAFSRERAINRQQNRVEHIVNFAICCHEVI